MTPDQKRGLRDVPKPWHKFLAEWREDVVGVIATGIDLRFPGPVSERRRNQACDIIELRELGHLYTEIGEILGTNRGTVASVLRRYRPDLLGRINA